MALLPAVRGLSVDLNREAVDVLLINIHDEVGAVLSPRFDFLFSPTFILFDADGAEVLRLNTLPRLEDIRLALTFNTTPEPAAAG